MTHAGVLKVNEFFNNKLSKQTDNIKVSITYIGNFGNQSLFQALRKIVKRAGYTDVKGQIDTLYCIVEGLKNADINDAVIAGALSGTSKSYLPAKEIVEVFKNMLAIGKITFDDRIRRDNMIALYLTANNFCMKTGFYTVAQHKIFFRKFIEPLMSTGLYISKQLEFKIDSADLYRQVYENSKSVITNMNSRGMSLFAIACHFWLCHRKFIPTPFLNHWSRLNFMQALESTPIFESEAGDDIKIGLQQSKVVWTVLSELSLMTGKVTNFDDKRKALNVIINKVLSSEGEYYIREYLKQIKLVASQNPIQIGPLPLEGKNGREAMKAIDKELQNQLKLRTTPIPAKEEIIESIKYQFMISRVLDVDFSSKRKDHIVFDKATRKRIFDIL